MLAHHVEGGGIADPLVERGRAAQVGEEQRHLPDRRLVAGPQRRLGEQVAEGLQRDDLGRSQRLAGPGAVLDQRRQLEARLVHEADLARGLRRQRLDTDRGRAQAGEGAAGMLDVGRRARMQRAQAVAARRQICFDGAPLAGRQQELHRHVRRGHRAAQAVAAGHQRPDRRRRREGELDVALEIAAVVDVARGAVRPARQLGECRDADLGGAAVVAQQVPFHRQQAGAHRDQTGLDRRPRRHAEVARQQLGAQMGEIARHAGQHMIGQPLAQPVAVGAAIDRLGERGGALARAGRQLGQRQVEHGRALAARKGGGLQHALLDRLANLARQALAKQPADPGQRLPFQGVAHLAAMALGRDLEHRPEAAERPLREDARLAKIAVEDPLVGFLLPGEGVARHLALAAAQHGAVGLRRLLEPVRRQAHRLVEAIGVGQHRPQPVGRQVEMPGERAPHGPDTASRGLRMHHTPMRVREEKESRAAFGKKRLRPRLHATLIGRSSS